VTYMEGAGIGLPEGRRANAPEFVTIAADARRGQRATEDSGG